MAIPRPSPQYTSTIHHITYCLAEKAEMETVVTNHQEFACPRCGSDEFDYIISQQLDEGDVRLQCSCRGECREGNRSFFLLLTPEFASRVLEPDEIARETAEPPFPLPM